MTKGKPKVTSILYVGADNHNKLRPWTNTEPAPTIPIYSNKWCNIVLSEFIKLGIQDYLIVGQQYLLDGIKKHLSHGEKFGVNIQYKGLFNGEVEIFNYLDIIDMDGNSDFYLWSDMNNWLNTSKFKVFYDKAIYQEPEVIKFHDSCILFSKKVIQKTPKNIDHYGNFNLNNFLKDVEMSPLGFRVLDYKLEWNTFNGKMLQKKWESLRLNSWDSVLVFSQFYRKIIKNTPKTNKTNKTTKVPNLLLPEVEAYKQGFIDSSVLISNANAYKGTDLYDLIRNIVE